MPTNPATLEHFSSLAAMIGEAQRKADADVRAAHGRFNVFTTLLSDRDEVRLHTRFLHCLLDPQGAHDRGPQFLNLFFATLAERPGLDHEDKPVEFPLSATPQAWTIEKEAACAEYGQMDLLLATSGSGIAIENKIDAIEQPEQLAKYMRYLRSRHGDSSRVIYLTLDGKQSDTHGGLPYIRISYATHILDWLERCLADTASISPIHAVILQYREVVRKLTGRSLSSTLMQPAVEYIRTHPDIITYRREIDAAIVAVRVDFLDRMAAALMSSLAPDYEVRLRAGLKEKSFGQDPNGALVIKFPESSPLARFEVWVEHVAKWQDALLIGIESKYQKSEPSESDRRLFEAMSLLLQKPEAATGHHYVGPRATWEKTWWPTGSHNLIYPFGDEKLAEVLPKEQFDKVIDELVNKVRIHIDLLEKTCRTALISAAVTGQIDVRAQNG